jgi:hypothetical protein
MSVMAAENLLAALKGERPPNLLNPDVLAARTDGELRTERQ